MDSPQGSPSPVVPPPVQQSPVQPPPAAPPPFSGSPDAALPDVTAVPSTEAGLRDLALRRLKKRQDFRAHLVVFIVVNGFLWALWAVLSLTNDWTFPWPIFPTLAWGIGLALNAWDVYGRHDITAADVDREVERLRRG